MGRKGVFSRPAAWASDFLEICMRGNPEEIRQAVLSGMDVNKRDVFGSTPLIRGLRWGWTVEVIKTLLEVGADVNAQDWEGWTPLMVAAQSGDTLITSLLLEAKAEVNTRNAYGCTALMYASAGKNPEVVRLLLEAGAEVNVRDKEGRTPLLWALEKSPSPEVVTLLLEAGADTNLVDNQGRGVAEYVVKNEHLRDTEIFRRFAPVSAWWYSTPGESRWTPPTARFAEQPAQSAGKSGGLKAVGGIFLFIGAILAVYGAVRLNSLEYQLGELLGFQDYTGIATLVIGIILGVTGVFLLVLK